MMAVRIVGSGMAAGQVPQRSHRGVLEEEKGWGICWEHRLREELSEDRQIVATTHNLLCFPGFGR